jgi:8-oxo-dGTP diphosphatase
MTTITEVAAAVIERGGEFLLAQRHEGKPYSGYWEFPGGKIEPGEDPRAALTRELRRGARGIEVRVGHALDHAHARVHARDGAPAFLPRHRLSKASRSRSRTRRSAGSAPAPTDCLSRCSRATRRCWPALELPAGDGGVESRRQSASRHWIQKLANARLGRKMLVQVREKGMERMKLQHLLSRALTRAEPFGVAIVDEQRQRRRFRQCRGVHLTAKALMAATTARPMVRRSGLVPRRGGASPGRGASRSTTWWSGR